MAATARKNHHLDRRQVKPLRSDVDVRDDLDHARAEPAPNLTALSAIRLPLHHRRGVPEPRELVGVLLGECHRRREHDRSQPHGVLHPRIDRSLGDLARAELALGANDVGGDEVARGDELLDRRPGDDLLEHVAERLAIAAFRRGREAQDRDAFVVLDDAGECLGCGVVGLVEHHKIRLGPHAPCPERLERRHLNGRIGLDGPLAAGADDAAAESLRHEGIVGLVDKLRAVDAPEHLAPALHGAARNVGPHDGLAATRRHDEAHAHRPARCVERDHGLPDARGGVQLVVAERHVWRYAAWNVPSGILILRSRAAASTRLRVRALTGWPNISGASVRASIAAAS